MQRLIKGFRYSEGQASGGSATVFERTMKMVRILATMMLAIVVAALMLPGGAEAGDKSYSWRDKSSANYRRGPQVRGFVQRRGGYSYSYADSVNTYGDSRSLFGGASSLRDPSLDRQTNAGPFDHGFFFDSAISPRGGDSPYMN